MKNKTLRILVFMILFWTNTFSQDNLVLNPSFEDTNLNIPCGINSYYLNFPVVDWQWGNGGTTDLFSMSLSQLCLMHPLNIGAANQLPRTGINYVGIYNRFGTDYREYVRGNLTAPVLVGYKYIIEFYVCLGETSTVGSNNIGLKFIDSSQSIFAGTTNIPLQPDVNYDAVPITDKEQWTQISFEFIPTVANLQSFIIGNFFTDTNTTLQTISTNTETIASYFLIDDVNIYIEPPFFDIIDEICQDETFSLPTTSLNGHTGVWSPQFNNQETTTYIFLPNDPNLPSVEKTIVVVPKVYPTFAEMGPFCKNVMNFSLPNISIEGIQGYWDKTFDPSISNSYIFTPTSGECVGSVTVDIEIYDDFDFDIKYYCENGQFYVEVFNIEIPQENVSNFKWSINNNLTNIDDKRINISNFSNLLTNSNTFEITITDKAGCFTTKSIQLHESTFCSIPKGISPNGDGLNDNLRLNLFQKIDLKIFNRFGTLIYSKKDYVDEWYGQSNSGEKLPSATYFYEIITSNGENFNGWIQLVN